MPSIVDIHVSLTVIIARGGLPLTNRSVFGRSLGLMLGAYDTHNVNLTKFPAFTSFVSTLPFVFAPTPSFTPLFSSLGAALFASLGAALFAPLLAPDVTSFV